MIIDTARVSNPENQGKEGTKLLSYLIRNRHFSPFEMASACFEIETTRDIARQILRHRSFSFQEFSQRYAEVHVNPQFREGRLQDPKNRQNSLPNNDELLEQGWKQAQEEVYSLAMKHYRTALDFGIAKEQARALLPEGLTPSRMYMSGTIRSFMHYLDVRTGNGTQKEHMDVAWSIYEQLFEAIPTIMTTVMENRT
ncbi:MAG: FAD-dependent thymidylate synthase [Podoviridae sp. ctbj_2]|nr:MAG: FAD-dependent thymidylate synthase [Podoviridae sp. ctbj_2]